MNSYEINNSNNSYFDGKLHQLIFINLGAILMTTLSFGILYPWAVCMILKWKAEHTVIDGRRLRFEGTASGLFGNWIKWWLLCIVTLGIYSFWLAIAMEEWKTKHTHFA